MPKWKAKGKARVSKCIFYFFGRASGKMLVFCRILHCTVPQLLHLHLNLRLHLHLNRAASIKRLEMSEDL